jgi:hypothetical protein
MHKQLDAMEHKKDYRAMTIPFYFISVIDNCYSPNGWWLAGGLAQCQKASQDDHAFDGQLFWQHD